MRYCRCECIQDLPLFYRTRQDGSRGTSFPDQVQRGEASVWVFECLRYSDRCNPFTTFGWRSRNWTVAANNYPWVPLWVSSVKKVKTWSKSNDSHFWKYFLAQQDSWRMRVSHLSRQPNLFPQSPCPLQRGSVKTRRRLYYNALRVKLCLDFPFPKFI